MPSIFGPEMWSTANPNEEHWHGATADRFMAHVAMQEADEEGQVVKWLEHVTDEEYGAAK
jgi:quercetin dioxygenase-like cupin family protein